MLAHLKRKNVSFYYNRVRAYYVKLTYVGFFFLFFVMNLSLMYLNQVTYFGAISVTLCTTIVLWRAFGDPVICHIPDLVPQVGAMAYWRVLGILLLYLSGSLPQVGALADPVWHI